ncbi:peptidylprolyl isomerase [Sphingorhabdus arenilitoris]|uniref:Peptidylprolyl isomerase n=1 Tax=Sphingorhabdus arenilitoris TaxID=1490041 RepID=A0ABV8RE87_9SPHN
MLSALCAAAFAIPAAAQDEPEGPPSPNEIVAQAKAAEWTTIAPSDLLVMDLAPDAKGKARRVVIQLMPEPFNQGWVRNIRKLAAAKWYDNISINRVQDNYVTQWGDPNYDNPAATGLAKPLPEGLEVMGEGDYVYEHYTPEELSKLDAPPLDGSGDSYANWTKFVAGLPMANDFMSEWPVHCYGMVGVGRNFSPDTGSGAELYAVIGHAPRHLDRNIALVGRIIEGMEHMSSLPRGTGPLGFYETPEERTPILSVRMGGDIADLPGFEYLSTESETFARYADARANRRDPFFIKPAGGADICNIPVPVRRKG